MEKKIFMARVADQSERYEDMVEFLQGIIEESSEDVSMDVKNLLSVGFKNLISAQRSAYKTVQAIEQNKKYSEYSENCSVYKEKISAELEKNCSKIISIVKDKSLPKASDSEAKVFYLKMIGDYYRYTAETAKDDKLAEVIKQALKYYDEASEAAKELKPYNSNKLGLALNFSVFHYELMNSPSTACKIAEEALNGARDEIDSMDNDEARDALSIIELLKENLDLWKEEEADDANGEDGVEDL
jgi:14-3-3 protein epsilon